MSYGLTLTGFIKKRLADIQAELEGDYQAAFGADVKLTGDSVLGELIGIQSERLAEVWELAEAVYGSAYPDTAAGVPLDNAVSLTGHARLPATYSTVTITAGTTGGSPVVLPAGRQVRVPATGATFETLAEATIPASSTVDIDCRAVETGPLAAPIGTLTEIVTPVSGWDTSTNAAAAILGRDQETDAALRLRRRDALQIAQAGSINAIEARLTEIPGVLFAGVAENRTDVTDGAGRPPHSIECVVYGGDDTAIAEAIWDAKPAGINTFGGTLVAVTDSFGTSQPIYFSRPTEIDIWVTLDLTTTAEYPGDGDDLAKAAVVAYVGGLGNGGDVTPFGVTAALAEIPGITSAVIYIGTAPAPAVPNVPVVIDVDEIAVTDLAKVIVT